MLVVLFAVATSISPRWKWALPASTLVATKASADVKRRHIADTSVRDRLASIPCFFVANNRGSPYLLNKEKEGAQECLIFLDPEDAERLVAEMAQASSQLSDARVYCFGMDRALALAQRKPTPSGNYGRDGQQLMLRYRIQPAQSQVEGARKAKLGKLGSQILPCFIAPEMQVTKNGFQSLPVFLDLEDLESTWKDVAAAKGINKKMPYVECRNLIDLVLAAEDEEARGPFNKLMFYPMPRTVDYVRRARKHGNGVARLHARLNE